MIVWDLVCYPKPRYFLSGISLDLFFFIQLTDELKYVEFDISSDPCFIGFT